MRRLLPVLPLLAACAEEPPPRQPEPPPLEVHETALVGEPAPADEVTVELLEPGREPRRRLRYRFEPGREQTMSTSGQTTMSLVAGDSRLMERELPSSVSTYGVRVASVGEDGSARIAFVLESGAPSGVIGPFGGGEEARETLEALEGRVVHTELDDRGLKLEPGFPREDEDPDLDPLAAQTLGPAVEMIATPLPKEPIGVGGRWKVSRASYYNGLYLPLVTEHRVVEMDGLRVVTETRFQGDAPAQKLGPFVDLRSLEGDSGGRSVLDLTRPAPVETETSASFRMKMRTRAGGEVSDFSMVIEEEEKVVAE